VIRVGNRVLLLLCLLAVSLIGVACGGLQHRDQPVADAPQDGYGVAWLEIDLETGDWAPARLGHWQESGGGEAATNEAPVDHGLEYWPLAQSRRDPRTGTLRQQWFGPIAETSTADTGRREVTVRPFYSYMRDPVAMTEESIILWPVFQSAASYRDYGDPDDRTRKSRVWLLPIFYYNRFSPIPGEWETDWFAPFPIVIGGDSTRDGAHFAVVPFGGTVKGLFGADEISFIAGPLYVEVREGEAKTWHFPFPLIRYGHGPRYKTHALLPLWAYSRQDSDYERYSLLWPLISWGSDQQSTRWPRQYWQVLPFAARHWTDQSSLVSIIPPFFNFERIEPTDTTIIDVPWPFLRFASGDNYEEFRIWPLYFRSRVGRNWTTSFAWPFFWQFDDHEDEWSEQRLWVLPIFWNRHRVFNEAGARRRLTPEQIAAQGGTVRDGSWQLWPLVRHEYDPDGSRRTRMLAILPPLGERFDRLYGELPSLLKIESSGKNGEVSLLWGGFGWSRWELPDEDGAQVGLIRREDYRIWPFWSERTGVERRVLVGPDGEASRETVAVDRSSFLLGLAGSSSEGSGDAKRSRARFLWLFEYDLD